MPLRTGGHDARSRRHILAEIHEAERVPGASPARPSTIDHRDGHRESLNNDLLAHDERVALVGYTSRRRSAPPEDIFFCNAPPTPPPPPAPAPVARVPGVVRDADCPMRVTLRESLVTLKSAALLANANGETPAYYAVRYGSPWCLQWLVEHGADRFDGAPRAPSPPCSLPPNRTIVPRYQNSPSYFSPSASV